VLITLGSMVVSQTPVQTKARFHGRDE